MTGKALAIFVVCLLLAAVLNNEAAACDWGGQQDMNSSTYNGYCYNQNWGWYGARKSVKSAEEARRDLAEFYADSDVKIGKIRESSIYFEAEILNKDNRLIGRVIIHKRSGRIRSIK